jgi:O-antigen/teichoic acid export membrane protein
LRRRAVINVVSSWGTLFLSAAISFFLAPFVVNSLGTTAYGAWALLGSLVGYLGLVDLGVRGAVTKYVATYHAAGSHAEASRITSAGLLFFSLASAVVLVGSGIAALGLDRMFQIPVELVDEARVAVLITGLTLAVSIIGGVFGGVVVALQRFDALNAIEVIATVVRAAATVWVLRRGGSLVALAQVQLWTTFARSLVHAVLALRLYPGLRVRLRGAWGLVPKVVSFGVVSTVLHLSSAVMNYSDSIIIGYFLPLEGITFFSIATTLVGYAKTVVSGVSQTVAPVASSLEGSGEMARVGGLMLTSGRFATLAVMPILATFVVRGHTFVALWMGEAFAAPAGPVLVMLSIGLWAASSFQVLTSTMIGIERHGGMVAAFVIEAVANLVLSIGLVQVMGLPGIALGILLPRLAITLGFGPAYARRVLGTRISAYGWHTLVRPVLAMVPFAAASLALELWWRPASLWLYFAQVAALLPLAALGAWAFALEREERRTAVAALALRWRRLRHGPVSAGADPQ